MPMACITTKATLWGVVILDIRATSMSLATNTQKAVRGVEFDTVDDLTDEAVEAWIILVNTPSGPDGVPVESMLKYWLMFLGTAILQGLASKHMLWETVFGIMIADQFPKSPNDGVVAYLSG